MKNWLWTPPPPLPPNRGIKVKKKGFYIFKFVNKFKEIRGKKKKKKEKKKKKKIVFAPPPPPYRLKQVMKRKNVGFEYFEVCN